MQNSRQRGLEQLLRRAVAAVPFAHSLLQGYVSPVDSLLTVDATGTACPVPIIELAKAIRRLAAGEMVVLLATDPAARRDLEAWCASTGHELISITLETGILRAQVRKTGA